MPTAHVGLADLLQSVHRRLGASLRAYVQEQETDLSLSQLFVMRELDADPGTTLSGLSRRTGFAKSHVKAIIDDLHRQAMVDKCDDEADQRLKRLTLTENGQMKLTYFRTQLRGHLDHLMSGIDAVQAEQLLQGLQILDTALDDQEKRGKGQ